MNLEEFIKENGLAAEIINTMSPTLTVEQSFKFFKCNADDILKSIVVVTDEGEYYLVILQGDRRIKSKKLKQLLKVRDLRLASPKQVEAVSGYKIGNVPPISVNLPVIVDELVVERDRIFYAGGGAASRSIKIELNELLDCTHPLIADVSTPL